MARTRDPRRAGIKSICRRGKVLICTLYIATGGNYYHACMSFKDDQDMIRQISEKLKSVPQESMFDAIYEFSGNWLELDDIRPDFLHHQTVRPVETRWTFDLDNDMLRFEKETQNSHIQLSDLRQRSVTLSDFRLFTPLRDHPCTMLTFFKPPFKLQCPDAIGMGATKRQQVFISILLSDFAWQWRHLWCSLHKEITFRRFAYAIVRLATLDFNTVEKPPRRTTRLHELPIPKRHELPQWEPSPGHILSVGNVHVVLCRRMAHAVRLIDKHKEHMRWAESKTGKFQYLILSTKTIMLYEVNGNAISYSKPEPFLDKANTLTLGAAKLLTTLFVGAPRTYIHRLPIELQDMILDYVSIGSIERERISCLLGIGTVPSKEGKDGRQMPREAIATHRSCCTPVESELWFGDCYSGLYYKC